MLLAAPDGADAAGYSGCRTHSADLDSRRATPSLRSDLISDRDRLRSQVEFRGDLARDPPRDRRDPLFSRRQKHRTPVRVIRRSAGRFDDRDADATTFLMAAEPLEDETLEFLTRFQLPSHSSVIPALFRQLTQPRCAASCDAKNGPERSRSPSGVHGRAYTLRRTAH
jgi:hypothetical protein